MTFAQKLNNIVFLLILLLAAFVRLYKLGTLPDGLNQDEAYAGYEAFSLLQNGVDSWGYRFPIYFISWGSGMNVLYSYILIPFFYALGLDIFVLRLPQALCAIVSCYVFYKLLCLMYDKNKALAGFFLVSIMPWHIMLARWGLEANLAPTMILCGFYFFCRSFEKSKYLLLSAFFYALAMYAYATCWVFVVVSFALQLIYFLIYRRLFKIVFISGIIYTLCIVPLFLLILVNSGVVDPMESAYFSVPKLLYWRGNEMGFNDLAIKFSHLIKILINQDDYLVQSRIPQWGLFYKFSGIFILYGMYELGKRAFTEIKEKKLSISLWIVIEILIGLIYSLTLYPCINRLNFLWFFVLFALVAGVVSLPKWLFRTALLIYAISFIFFAKDYLTQYNKISAEAFSSGLEQALTIADAHHQNYNQNIYILETVALYPKVLFLRKIPQEEYIKTVQWKNYPQAYLEAASISHYHFVSDFDYFNISTDNIYILPKDKVYYFYKFNISYVGNFAVATPK